MSEKISTILYMVIIAGVFTSAVTAAKIWTADRIRLNEKIRFERVVLHVLGLDQNRYLAPEEVKDLYARRITEKAQGDMTVYCGYADDGKTKRIGYAFPIGGMGLWSKIEGMLALNEKLDTIIGVDFTKQGETPGLGGRISETWFRDQFKGKSVAQKDSGGRYVRFVGSDKPLSADEVHGITGASITTNSVAAFLNSDIERIRTAMGRVKE